MEIQLLFFGITEDIVGQKRMSIELNETSTIGNVRHILTRDYPKLEQYKSFSMALNMEYADDDTSLKPGDTVALIPPVSGG